MNENPAHGPAYHAPFQPQPRKSNAGKIALFIVIAVVAVGVCLVGGLMALLGLGANEHEKEVKAKVNEVTILDGGCRMTEFGPEVEYEVTNKSDRTRSYWVTITFEQSGTRVGDVTGIVNDLAPGQTAKDKAVLGSFNGNKSAEFTCALNEVK